MTSIKTTGAMLGAAALALTLASAGMAQTTNKAATLSAMDKKFMTTAAQGGLFEVHSSEIALKKTSNSHVLAVAKRMIKEHSAANKELATVAQDVGYTLPKETDAKHLAAMSKMKSLSGSAFDKYYIGQQEVAHTATVKLLHAEIATGLDKDVTAFATKNLPEIEDHTKMIYQVGTGLDVHAGKKPMLKGSMMPSSMSGKHMKKPM